MLCILIVVVVYSYYNVYIFLLLCLFRSGYSVLLCCSVYCLCVNVYSTLLYCTVQYSTVLYCTVLYYCHRASTQLQLTNISYHISSHYISYHTAVAQWLRCCVTNRKVVGSIPDGVIGIFH